LIAEKVEFSGLFMVFLTAGLEADRIRQRLERLLAESEKLKNLYINLWLARCQPEGLARVIREFDLLEGRFHHLLQGSAHPAARKKLLAEFESHSPAE
jgi:hypothetical protein